MSKVRVIQVIPTLRCGGAERMVVNLMTHLDRQRFQTAVIVLGPPEGWDLEQRLSEERFQLWFLDKRRAFDVTIPFQIRRVLRDFRPHLIHSHLTLQYIVPATVGRSIPHLTTVHLPAEMRHRRLTRLMNAMAFRRGVIPVAVSRDVAVWLSGVYGVKDCAVIPNGIPISEYQRSSDARKTWRESQGVTGNDVIFVCVARLEKQKNHGLLVKAFARVRDEAPGAQLLLAGDGVCRPELESQIDQSGLHGRVHLLGQRSDIPELLAAADVFVLASDTEGNPLSVMEAMAAGLPVVATAVGGVPELVDQRSGVIVKAGDCDRLADAMLHLYQDIGARRAMAASAAERASNAFSVSSMARRYMDLYESIVTSGMAVSRTTPPQMVPHYQG